MDSGGIGNFRPCCTAPPSKLRLKLTVLAVGRLKICEKFGNGRYA
jgi:hypothetical protein